MTPAEGRESIQRELEAHGVSRWTTAPLLWRLLWAMNIDVPPPHFIGFGWLAILGGFAFAVVFGTLLHAFGNVTGSPSPVPAFGFPATGGVVFGLYMAWSWRRARDRFRLPSWQEYLRSGKVPDDWKVWEVLPPSGPPTSPPSP